MSILRDLEPQNAKIHYSPQLPSKSNQIALTLAVLLLLGGAIALFSNTQPQQIQTATHHPAMPDSTNPGAPDSSPLPASASSPGSAQIRENVPAQNNREPSKAHDENVLLAMQMEPGKKQGGPLTSNMSPQVGKPNLSTTVQLRKTMNSATARKLPKNTARRSTANGRHNSESDKRPMERDIDIITAIVK